MAKRWFWSLAAVGTVLGCVLAMWLVQGWGGEFATKAADDLGQLVSAAFGAACCLVVAFRATGRPRVTWLAMGAGLAAWSAGEGVWSYYELWLGFPEAPFPSLADVGFLLFLLAAVVALLVFPGGGLNETRFRWGLDGVIASGSLFIVSWVIVLGKVYRTGGEDTLGLTVALAYPVGDLVLVTITLLILARSESAQRLSLGLLVTGILVLSFSDSAFAYLTATNPYRTGDLIDMGWVIGFMLLGLAAVASSGEPADGRPAIPRRASLWLPYLPLLLATAVCLPRALGPLRSGPIPSVAIVLVTAILVRQFITVADNQRLLFAMAHQAFHDPLTGLPNRALFTDRMQHALQQHERSLRPLAVACLDLNGFKPVNDTYGHAAGDQLLIRVAERLTACLGTVDTVARLGGDEFAVLIEEDLEGALLVAHRIMDAFAPPFVVNGHSLSVEASIGFIMVPAHMRVVSADALLSEADQAMYLSKRDGGGLSVVNGDPWAAQNSPPGTRSVLYVPPRPRVGGNSDAGSRRP